MVTQRTRYLAYMLRLWRVGEDKTVWRASLEDAHSGARQGFASLDALVSFLVEKTGQGPLAASEDPGPRSMESQGRD